VVFRLEIVFDVIQNGSRSSLAERQPIKSVTQKSDADAIDYTLKSWPADSRQLQHLSRTPFNLHKARVRRASGFLLTAFSNARPNPLFRPALLTKGAPPKKHSRYPAVGLVGHSDPRIGLSTKSLAEKRLDYARFSDHASVIPITRYQQI
jgi:hypothetical protein